jgi:long-chain acyl-CoA synthetase
MPTLHGKLLSLLKSRGDRPAFGLQSETGGYRRVSAAAYAEKSLRFSAFLKSRGLQQGDRLALVSENGPEWTMAALAAMNLGVVVVPVASIASPLEISNSIRASNPKLSIISRHIASFRAAEDFLHSENLPYLAWDLQWEDPLHEWIEGRAPLALNKEDNGDDSALLIFTSGTTGHPKGVPLSHNNLLFVSEGSVGTIGASQADRLVSILPLSHVLEFAAGFVAPVLVGAQVTYLKSLKADDLLAALKDNRATIFAAVPLFFEVLQRNLQSKLDKAPFPFAQLFDFFRKITLKFPSLGPILFYPVHQALGGHIRFLLAGGSRLQPATFDFFRGLGITLVQGYGLTETSPVLAVSHLGNAGSDHVGTPLKGVEVGIFADDGRRLSVGEEGEIWAKGPGVFRGYLDSAHNEGVFKDGWFCTGDLGRLDEQNLLRITGRKKDIIVTPAGKNVYPEEIETFVMQSGAFQEVCVLGMQDAAGHEKVTMVLVPDRSKFPGKSISEIEKAAAMQASEICRELADYKRPQRIEIRFEELPKTSTRKIKKYEVKKLLAAGKKEIKEGGGEGLDLNKPLEQTIGEGIESITKIPASSVRLSDSLTKDLGMDSLTLVELLSSVEARFSTKIEGLDFAVVHTVKDLIGALEFAAQSAPKKNRRVFFTDFHPSANGRLLWRLPRRLINVALRSWLKIRFGLEVEGLENLRGGGPFVFTPNHSSHMDLLSIAGSVPGPMVHDVFAVAAKDYFFNRTWKALAARIFVNAIPFDRKGRVQESMSRCREALDMGASLVIFPEGTRSPDGKLQDFKPGAGQLLAGHPKARAVPVYIDGAYGIMPKGSHSPGPGKLKLRYGVPISFQDSAADALALRAIADRLRKEVEALR